MSLIARRHRTGRIKFFAHLEKIRADLDSGYSIILLHEKYREALSLSYSQFGRYVRQYLTNPLSAHPPVTAPVAGAPRERRDSESSASTPGRGTGPSRFNYDKLKPKDSLV